MRGCLSLPFRLVGLALVAIIAWVAWGERDAIRRWLHRITAEQGAPAAPEGSPDRARERAMARLDSLARGRIDSVRLGVRELEAVVAPAVVARAGGAIDSVVLVLGDDEVAVRGRLDGDRFSRSALGPLAEWVAGREPIEARGPLVLRRLGRGEWRISTLKVRGVPLPRALGTRLAELVVPAQGGEVGFDLPAWVTGIRVTAAGVVLYGRGAR